ncbi:MAG: glycosyltransferase [Bacteroidales bacterium]|jgi:cellulose synthase/poly-beta-1,6-N-acetylglucosamine synthase-like glycosyltransferase|nr:glycosyltransferase [Bacteroidales bacterium]
MLIIYIVLIFYVSLVFAALYGWQKKSRSGGATEIFRPTISIIVALRNEKKIIPTLIKSLNNIDYQHHLMEILLVDDHSTDDTFAKLQEFTHNNMLYTILQCPPEVVGKKQALAWAVAQTKNDYILFTDADCQVPPTWISAYVEHIAQHSSAHFFFGLVTHSAEKNVLQKWFTLDFLSLVAMQGGLANVHKAFSCNAANMCISRQFAHNQYETNSAYSSGDDVFLLHKAKQIDKKAVVFVGATQAMVTTAAPKTIRQFITQRIRWASKTGGYRDWWSVAVALLVYATNLCVLSTAIFSLLTTHYEPLIVAFGVKTFVDVLFFACILPTFQKQKLLPQVVVFQAFYVLYIVLIPIFALCFPQSWKGRKIT